MIPVVDLSNGDVTEKLGQAIETFGFARIRAHEVPDALIERARSAAAAFWAQPQQVKDRYSQPPYRVGHMAYDKGAELARSATVPDDKEVFGFRKYPGAPLDPIQHLWVPEVPDFRAASLELFTAFEALTRRIMRPLALKMGEKANWFEPHFNRSDSYMRYLHYPKAGNGAEHDDLNLITILLPDKPGLFVRDHKGGVHEVMIGPGELILNGGMQLAALTNNHLYPCRHWVHASEPRDTIVFFAHPNADMMLKPLAQYPVNARAQDPDWFPPRAADGSYGISVADFNAGEIGRIYAASQKKAASGPAAA